MTQPGFRLPSGAPAPSKKDFEDLYNSARLYQHALEEVVQWIMDQDKDGTISKGASDILARHQIFLMKK